ncbi:MAG: dockerin type I domain-containing protein [Clostridium sp.]|nr:MAG: dockerin type I domain-containing protein [Clostridium sp.]
MEKNNNIRFITNTKKYLLGDKKLTTESLMAADTSGDSKVSILDLLQVQKNIYLVIKNYKER